MSTCVARRRLDHVSSPSPGYISPADVTAAKSGPKPALSRNCEALSGVEPGRLPYVERTSALGGRAVCAASAAEPPPPLTRRFFMVRQKLAAAVTALVAAASLAAACAGARST